MVRTVEAICCSEASVVQALDAVELSKAALGKIKQNLAWALVYNLAAIPLAAGAMLPAFGLAISPSVAGGLMAVSSLAVVSNSLLLGVQQGLPSSPSKASLDSSARPREPSAGAV